MSAEKIRKWAVLRPGAAVLTTGCATVSPSPSLSTSRTYNSRAAPGPALVGELHQRRDERVPGTNLAMVSPGEIAVRAVTGGTVNMDAFEHLLLLAGLDNVEERPPRDSPLTPQEAARMLALLPRKPMRLGAFPPRMAIGHLLREVLESGAVSREEMLRRVERFKNVAVLRPDGYLAWTLDGRTLQKVGPVEWKDEAFRAGPFELGRFYTGTEWVFRPADAQLRPIREGPPLAEVYDDADYISRTLDGAEEAFIELYHAMGQFLTRPLDSIAALQHLPVGVASLISSSPEYFERFRYMTRGEQAKALSKLTTNLIVTFGTAAGTTRTLTQTLGGLEATVPVLSLSADGLLVVERIVVPLGTVGTVLSGGPGAAIILQKVDEASEKSPRAPQRTAPRIEDGNLKEGWQHIEARHITGNHPKGPGDLFAPGTTRQQLVSAAEEIIKAGNRLSRPGERIQTFQMKIKINGRKELVQVVGGFG